MYARLWLPLARPALLILVLVLRSVAVAQPAPTVIKGYAMPARPLEPASTSVSRWWDDEGSYPRVGPHGSIRLDSDGAVAQVTREDGYLVFRVPFTFGTFSPDGQRLGGCDQDDRDTPGMRMIVEADGRVVPIEPFDCWSLLGLADPAPGPEPGLLALAYGDHVAWRGRDGALHQTEGRVTEISWSIAGDLAFALSDGSVFVAPGGGEATAARPSGLSVRALAWSPDGDQLAVLRPGELELHSESGGARFEVPYTARRVSFDGDNLVVAWSSGVDLYSASTGRLVRRGWDPKGQPGLDDAARLRSEGNGPVLLPYGTEGWRDIAGAVSAWQWDDALVALFDGARYLGALGSADRNPREVSLDPSGGRVAILSADGHVGVYGTSSPRPPCSSSLMAPARC